MTKKETRTFKNWALVINWPKEKSELLCSLNLSTDILKPLVDYYKGSKCYLVLHDKDTNEDGTFKTPHLHCVISLETKRSKVNILSDVSSVLSIPENCVSADNCINLGGAIRYLIHKGFDDKYQYNVEDIKSNDMKYSKYFMDIGEYIVNCTSINDMITDLGADNAQKYLSLYKQSLSERNETPMELKRQLNIFKNMCYDKDNVIQNLQCDCDIYKKCCAHLISQYLKLDFKTDKELLDYCNGLLKFYEATK